MKNRVYYPGSGMEIHLLNLQIIIILVLIVFFVILM